MSPIESGARGRDRSNRERPLKWKRALLAALLATGGWLALRGAAEYPDRVESIYSGALFPVVRGIVRSVAGLVPVSLAEILLGALSLWVLLLLFTALRAWRKRGRTAASLLLRGVLRAITVFGFLYFLMLVTWGFNHSRRPYASHAGLEAAPVSPEELAEVSAWLVGECNRLRGEITADDLVLEEGAGGVDPRLLAGFRELAEDVPTLWLGRPLLRRPWLSWALTRLGISGIYSPFTGEAHLNGQIVDWLRPFTSCHEVAHLKGFAREDEASFIAWQVCRRSGDEAFAYSASAAALGWVLGALAGVDRERARTLAEGLSEEVRADLTRNREFWAAHRSFVTDVSSAVNDRYLRSQGQEAGVASYGRMVDLLVAEWRQYPPAGGVHR